MLSPRKTRFANQPGWVCNFPKISRNRPWYVRIRVDAASAIMRKRSVLACIEPQLLTDRPTGAACARTGCNNIVSDTGSLRGKVGVLVPRSPRSLAPESRTRRRLPHLIARQFSNLQVRHVFPPPLARGPRVEMSSQKVPLAGGSRARAKVPECRLAPFRIAARPL